MEPELARAHLAELPSPASEQYSVAALLYLVITGAHTHNFVLEERQMQRQVADERPLAFREHRVRELSHVEQTLRRALDKDPALRFPTMGEFLRHFSEASAADQKARRGDPVPAPRQLQQAQRLLREILERLAIAGPLLGTQLEAPTASLSHGAAGFAYALLRIACTRGDEKLLARRRVVEQGAAGCRRLAEGCVLECGARGHRGDHRQAVVPPHGERRSLH